MILKGTVGVNNWTFRSIREDTVYSTDCACLAMGPDKARDLVSISQVQCMVLKTQRFSKVFKKNNNTCETKQSFITKVYSR